MKNLALAILFVTGVIATGEVRADGTCLMAAAVPCPPVAMKQWWLGAWATRMQDSAGSALTGFTLLKPNGKYVSTLEYDDGRKVEEWGSYKIEFPRGAASVSHIHVEIKREATEIETKVETSTYRKSTEIVNLMAAPIPSAARYECDCAEGRIVYKVEGFSPSNLNFPTPQVFKFVEQGPGYVRVWGNGVDGKLSRRYS